MSDDKKDKSQQSLINSYWAMKKKHLEDSGAPDLSGESDAGLERRQQESSGPAFAAPDQQQPSQPSGGQSVEQPQMPAQQPQTGSQPQAQTGSQPQAQPKQRAQAQSLQQPMGQQPPSRQPTPQQPQAPQPSQGQPLGRRMESPFGKSPAPDMSTAKGDSLASANGKAEESDEDAAMRIARELSLLADKPAKPANAPDPVTSNSPKNQAEAEAEALAEKLVQQASLAAVSGTAGEDRSEQIARMLTENGGQGRRRRSRYTQPVAAATNEGQARLNEIAPTPQAAPGKFKRGATPKTDVMQDRMERRLARRDQESAELIERHQSRVEQAPEPMVLGRSGLGREIKATQPAATAPKPGRMSATAAHIGGARAGNAAGATARPGGGMEASMAAEAMAGVKSGRGSNLRMRILPVTIIGAACLFGAKVGSIMLDSGILVPQITENSAIAQEAAPQEGGDAAPDIQVDGVSAADGAVIDPVTGEVLTPAPVGEEAGGQPRLGSTGVGGTNLFAPGLAIDPTELNGSEIEVLQGLRARREKLAAHEADLRIRERELEAIEQRIDEKIAEMRRIQGTIDSLLEKYDQEKDAQVQSLVKIYETMKPKKAARVFELMQMEKLLDIAERMKEKKLSPILAVMDPRAAQLLTEELYNRRRLPELRRSGQP